MSLTQKNTKLKYKLIAVDFDDTLCHETYPDCGKPDYRAFNTMIKFRKAGGKLILWTCRYGENLKNAIKFCHDLGLDFDAVNENEKEQEQVWAKVSGGKSLSPKVFAELYIDDRTVGGLDWDKISKDIFINS